MQTCNLLLDLNCVEAVHALLMSLSVYCLCLSHSLAQRSAHVFRRKAVHVFRLTPHAMIVQFQRAFCMRHVHDLCGVRGARLKSASAMVAIFRSRPKVQALLAMKVPRILILTLFLLSCMDSMEDACQR